MNIFIDHRGNVKIQRLEYVLNFIESHPLNDSVVKFVPGEHENYNLRLEYGPEQGDGIWWMPSQGYLLSQDDFQPELLHCNAFILEEQVLYSVETEIRPLSKPFIEAGKFQFDIFETIFFHISRLEEIFCKSNSKDAIGLVPEENYLLVKNNVHDIPVVDELIRAFLKVLGVEIKNRQTEYILTHDIDKIYKYNSLPDGLKAIGWPLIFRKSVIESLHNFYHFLKVFYGKQKDPYDTYQWLFSDNRFWKSKVVYFMAGGKTNYDLFDKHYKKSVKGVIDLAKDMGYEIGIHPSFETGKNESLLPLELSFLRSKANRDIIHSRQHWLRFFHSKTPFILESNNIEFDSSLGYRKRIGFRSGTGFLHRLYNFVEERSFNFYVRPLVIMDSALLHVCHDDVDTFEDMLKKFLLQNHYNTCITFNFHNSTFDYTLGERSRLINVYSGVVHFLDNLSKERPD